MEKYEKVLGENLFFAEASDVHPASTHFHFSFADYYDPDNMNFGVLRVLNDDRVKPNSGFGTHPHRDMEIVSYVVDGKLTHRDSAGNHEVLSRGHVQFISAGTGVTHSELNEQNDWCRFLQIWILPEKIGLPVRYGLKKFEKKYRENKLFHFVSGSRNENEAPIHIFQDVNFYVSELTEKNKAVSLSLSEGRQAYINCFEGQLNINQKVILDERDSLKVYGSCELEFSINSDNAHFIIFEMAAHE